ncbi:uncharacterized protein PAC_19833 [Phialocephala subalpina]|uniref:Uncharacterized protein n=1 Tax=Phialocephala subalpina TaxID=576137 RepID=A0A1L7XXX7_9HELO|nr:uncharacterized protein PAC_19833 [Phialocephala subalpina]
MDVLSRWTTSLALTPEQLVTYQVSLISLFILPLCTLIFYLIISSSSHGVDAIPSTGTNINSVPRSVSQNAFRVPFFDFLLGTVILFLWLGALITWSLSLGSVSPVLRNNALLYGVLAANAVPLYLLFVKRTTMGGSGCSLEGLIGLMLWPLYAGMLMGTLGFGSELRRSSEM